jgi:hypothetical protein
MPCRRRRAKGSKRLPTDAQEKLSAAFLEWGLGGDGLAKCQPITPIYSFAPDVERSRPALKRWAKRFPPDKSGSKSFVYEGKLLEPGA